MSAAVAAHDIIVATMASVSVLIVDSFESVTVESSGAIILARFYGKSRTSSIRVSQV